MYANSRYEDLNQQSLDTQPDYKRTITNLNYDLFTF